MDAGSLRERIAIEVEKRQPNGQGGFTTGWATVKAGIPAEVIAMTGNEALRLGVERSASQYRVRIRKRSGLTPANRVKWTSNGDQVMAVKSVLQDPRDPAAALLLICEIGLGS